MNVLKYTKMYELKLILILSSHLLTATFDIKSESY